jgi:Uma2 family endonuclease
MSAEAIVSPASSTVLPDVPAPSSAKWSSPTWPPPAGVKVSVEEYLERERASEVRHEYVNGLVIPKDGVYETEDGEIRAMSGESPAHNRVAGNIFTRFARTFEDRECEVFFENIRVCTSPTQYRYPDVIALCGNAQFDNDNPPALLNPGVIVEVLSPSTQTIDRGEKFFEYREISTLTDYVLVAQDRMWVLHYVRQSANQWTVTDITAPTDMLTLPSLQVALSLTDIYRRVTFAPLATP